jgi:hypothetical protein
MLEYEVFSALYKQFGRKTATQIHLIFPWISATAFLAIHSCNATSLEPEDTSTIYPRKAIVLKMEPAGPCRQQSCE